MPQEFVKDPKTGRWVLRGTATDKTAYISEQPAPTAKPKPKPRAKSWWEQTLNHLQYETKRIQQNPQGAARTYLRNTLNAPGAAVQNAATAPIRSAQQGLNNLRFEDRQLADPKTRAQRLTQYGTNAVLAVTANPATFTGQIVRQGLPAAATSLSNLTRNVGQAGSGIDRYEDSMYQLAGQKPPSEMNAGELQFAQIKASLVSSYALGMFGAGALGKVAPQLLTKLDPALAPNLWQAALRTGVAEGLTEIPQTVFEDNTGGSAAGLMDAVLGTKTDPVKPGMSHPEAMAAAFVPNAIAGSLFAGALSALPAATQAIRGQRLVDEKVRQRAVLDDAGITQSNPETGQSAFVPEAIEKPAPEVDQAAAAVAPEPAAAAPTPQPKNWAEADAEAKKALGIEEPAAEGKPAGETTAAPGPWEEAYDPELPEADVALDILERLDDDELPIAVQSDDPVATAAELIESRPEVDPAGGLEPAMVRADGANLAQPMASWRSQWQALPTSELQVMAMNSEEVSARLVALTGKSPTEATKVDLLDAFDSLAADGSVYIPSRMNPTNAVIPTGEISVDPARFQFKQGVDAKGQQKGNSLSGVDQWSTDAEGSIQVWNDPADGKVYVVNGHNRVAKAQELGIPSLRAEELLAGTAEEARAAGALSNIASGGGTAFDAAKFFRDSGVTDPAALQQMGIPLASGTGRAGVALAQLPDNIFQDAIDGKISQGKAVALGESGLSPESMQQAYKALQGSDMTDGTWAEVLDQARSAPVVEGSQVDLFGNTETMNLMVQKGDLARRIRAEIAGDKKLFGTVKRNAGKLEAGGNQIDATASGDIAAKAQALLDTFDVEKYAAGTPISELLNKGAEEVANGAYPRVVARRLKQELVQSLDQVQVPKKPRTAAEQNPEERWQQMPAEQQDARAADSKKALLGERALQNRLAFEEDYKANEAQVQQYLEDMPGSNSGKELTEEQFIAKYGADESLHPQLKHKGGTLPKQLQELESHRGAEQYLDWYDNRRQPPELTPEDRQAMQVAAVQKAAANGKVRPPATPIPELPQTTANLEKAAKDLANGDLSADAIRALDDEVRLREHYQEMEARADAAHVQEMRDAVGYDQLTYDQKKALGATDGFTRAVAPPTPAVEIPAAASRKITLKTSESRIRGAAESLVGWTKKPGGQPMSLDKAMELVRAKGAILDPDKIPGLDMDAARNDAAMGRAVPEVTAAYKQFYGLDDPTPAGALTSEMGDLGSDLGGGYEQLPEYDQLTPYQKARLVEVQALADDLASIVREVAGSDVDVHVDARRYIAGRSSKEYGGMKRPTELGGWYSPMEDLVVINGALTNKTSALIQTAYHEAFHRLQYAVLTKQEMQVLDGAMAKIKTVMGTANSMKPGAKWAMAEHQAVAFQKYAYARTMGMDPVQYMMGALGDNTPRAQKALAQAMSVLNKLWNVVERVNNWARGRGFDSVEDIYNRAFLGELGKREPDFLLENITSDQIARNDIIESWRNRMYQATSEIQQLDAEMESIRAMAAKGGC